jgi:hypothetical protein
MDGAGSTRRETARRMQSLYIRLMFCNRVLERYLSDPLGLLAEFGLPADAQRSLPDPNDPNFQAEAAGRKTGVYKEIVNTFQNTLTVLERIATSGAPDVPRLSFAEYLSSDYFYDPVRALPDPNGVGPGYENSSKFFLWVCDGYRIRTQAADAELRRTLYSEFALYLLALEKQPVDAYYKRFKGAVMWPRVYGVPLPVQVVTDKQVMLTVSDPAKVAQLGQIGIVDLDTVVPVAYEAPPNIM